MARKKKMSSYESNYQKIAFARKAKILLRRFYKIGFACGVFFLFAMMFWLYNYDKDQTFYSFFKDKFHQGGAKIGLKLDHVAFEGDNFVGQEELVAKLNLQQGTPILGVDLEDLRARINKETWIEDSEVRRTLPSEIKIVIKERKPIAIWQLKGKYYLIDKAGVKLTEVDSPDVLPFPLVVGEGANIDAVDIFAKLEVEKAIFDKVQSAVRKDGRRWNIIFNNGIEVYLPADNMEQAWQKLARLQEEKKVLDRQIKTIDLRIPDRIYIKTLDGEEIKNSVRSKSA